MEGFCASNLTADEFQSLSVATKSLCEDISSADRTVLRTIYCKLIVEIKVGAENLCITLNNNFLQSKLNLETSDVNPVKITKYISIKRRGQEMKMVVDGQERQIAQPDEPLIKQIAKAHLLKTELDTGAVTSIKQFAVKYKLDHGDAKNLTPLIYLAPSIIEDILAGYQPVDLNARQLRQLSDLPTNWSDQRQFLGFN